MSTVLLVIIYLLEGFFPRSITFLCQIYQNISCLTRAKIIIVRLVGICVPDTSHITLRTFSMFRMEQQPCNLDHSIHSRGKFRSFLSIPGKNYIKHATWILSEVNILRRSPALYCNCSGYPHGVIIEIAVRILTKEQYLRDKLSASYAQTGHPIGWTS